MGTFHVINSLLTRSPLSTIFPIVLVPGRTKLVLSGDPLYIKLQTKAVSKQEGPKQFGVPDKKAVLL